MKSEIRKEIIRLLKENESFRYEVLGLLEIRDLMDELKKLREDFNRFIRLSERRWRENKKDGEKMLNYGKKTLRGGKKMIEGGRRTKNDGKKISRDGKMQIKHLNGSLMLLQIFAMH